MVFYFEDVEAQVFLLVLLAGERQCYLLLTHSTNEPYPLPLPLKTGSSCAAKAGPNLTGPSC